jgi:NAD-dependent deacetylase
MPSHQEIAALAEKIRPEARITALTGAGVSAASGVPTFRGAGGLWRNYSAHDLATPEAFRRNPGLVWEWYNWRREVVSKCRPNPAHQVLAAWSRRFPRFQLVTQNVDGLHERAGTKGVIRFHGSIWEVLCWERCASSPARWWDDTVPFLQIPPSCPYCGGLIRPGVVWFGETINPEVLARSLEVADCDLFLSVGTSTVVYPAAGLAHEAKKHGAFTAEINREVTPASDLVDLSIRGPAEEVLQEVEDLLLSAR